MSTSFPDQNSAPSSRRRGVSGLADTALNLCEHVTEAGNGKCRISLDFWDIPNNFPLSLSSPLFVGSDPIKIYTMVLYGIEKMDFPKKIGKRPDDLIRRLCKYKDKTKS